MLENHSSRTRQSWLPIPGSRSCQKRHPGPRRRQQTGHAGGHKEVLSSWNRHKESFPTECFMLHLRQVRDGRGSKEPSLTPAPPLLMGAAEMGPDLSTLLGFLCPLSPGPHPRHCRTPIPAHQDPSLAAQAFPGLPGGQPPPVAQSLPLPLNRHSSSWECGGLKWIGLTPVFGHNENTLQDNMPQAEPETSTDLCPSTARLFCFLRGGGAGGDPEWKPAGGVGDLTLLLQCSGGKSWVRRPLLPPPVPFVRLWHPPCTPHDSLPSRTASEKVQEGPWLPHDVGAGAAASQDRLVEPRFDPPHCTPGSQAATPTQGAAGLLG